MQRSIPRLHPRLITRPRLVHALRRWRDYRVVCVQAPAGFGKTTLAAMWLRNESTKDAIAVWWSLSEHDDDEAAFLKGIASALAPRFASVHDAITLHDAGQISADVFFHEILCATHEADRPLLIVIDDAHMLRDAAPLRRLHALIEDGPAALHLALLARPPLPIDLTTLRMSGAVLDLGMQDLRLDPTEAEAVIDRSRHAHLDAPRRRRLAERASGWIAGMQLVLHSLPATLERFDESASIADAEDHWAEYLERELVGRLAPDLRRFLLAAATLPYLDPHLCAEAMQLSPDVCAQLLRRSARETGFLTQFTTPDDAPIHRIHPILKDVLLRRMPDAMPAAEQRELRRRATHWLARHEQIDAALSMLLPAQGNDEHADVEFAAELVERACRPALLRADTTAVRRWLARLPEEIVRRRPRLALEACWLAVHSLDPQLHSYLIRLQQSMAQHSERSSEPSGDLTAEVAVLHALCTAFEGNFSKLGNALLIAERVAPPLGSVADGYLHALRAYHLGLPRRGSVDRVRELYQAFAIFGRIGFVRGQVEVASLAGVVAASDGQRSTEEYANALEFIRQVGWERSSFGMHTHVWFAENLYNHDRIAEARAHLLRAIELARSAGDAHAIEAQARIYLQLCHMAEHGAASQAEESLTTATEWAQIIKKCAPRLLYVTVYNRLLCSLKYGRTDECWQIVHDLGLTPERAEPHAVPFSVVCAVAGALFSGHAVRQAGELLEKFRACQESFDYPALLLRTRILNVVYLERSGRTPQALHELRELLPDVERMHMPRLVSDLPMLHPLLRRCDTPFAARLLAHTPATRVERAFGLSEQELRVLRMLAEKHSTHEIAAELHVTYDTVRKHLKSCYRKMSVHGQVAAIQTARKRGIL